MRRSGAFLALLALACAVVSVGGGSLGQARAATCVKHTKRVVKHVKRHGKRVRIVRPRHSWTCEEAPTVGPPAPATAVPAPSSPVPAPSAIPAPTLELPPVEAPAAPQPQPEPEANAIGVIAEDKERFGFFVTHTTVKPGRLVIQLTNNGEDPHAMDMQRVGLDGELEGPLLTELEAGPEAKEPPSPVTVEVQPGTYRMWCPIGHHAEHGMTVDVTVR